MQTYMNSVMNTGRIPNNNEVNLPSNQNNWQQENTEIVKTSQIIPNNFRENSNASSVGRVSSGGRRGRAQRPGHTGARALPVAAV